MGCPPGAQRGPNVRQGAANEGHREVLDVTPVLPEPVSIKPALARRIEIRPVGRLVPYARNARTHSDAQVAQIAASIAEFGFNAPILVDSNAGIVAGHGRLLAARKLGLPEVPGVVLDHLTDTQRRAYIIADNKLSENAGWNEDVLAAELADLEHEGLDLRLVGWLSSRSRAGQGKFELFLILRNSNCEHIKRGFDIRPLIDHPSSGSAGRESGTDIVTS
jgi:hypothetical protein